jgi:hypothetical protein
MIFKIQKLNLIFCFLWMIAVSAGFGVIWKHENSPGRAAQPPTQWPLTSGLERKPGVAALILLAHPKCPCTRATIEELAYLMSRVRGRVQTHVLFYQPGGFEQSWSRTDIWESAAVIPGVIVWEDWDGVEAHRFGAETSGQSLLYDASGKLLFSGGITGSRGHVGDNAGRDAIVSLLSGAIPARRQTAVFGCPLFDRQCAGETEADQ